MEDVHVFDQLLTQARKLLAPVDSASLHFLLSHYSILRPSLMQEHSGAHDDDFKAVIKSLRQMGPRSKQLKAPSSDSESDSQGSPSLHRSSECIIDSQEILLSVQPK